MYDLRLIVRLIVLAGLLMCGCTSSTQNKPEPSEILNQVDSSGLKQGLWEEYADTLLISRGRYADGLPDGLWTRWHANGQMKEEGHYEKGVKSGMWVEWYPDGVIMWKGEWDHGTRKVTANGARAEVLFSGQELPDRVLSKDSMYHVQIRVQNIPSGNLFVEVSSGEITREKEDSDQFLLKTSSDSEFTLAIGFIPDLDFVDFRDLLTEIEFKLK